VDPDLQDDLALPRVPVEAIDFLKGELAKIK